MHTTDVQYNGFTYTLAIGIFSTGGSIIIDIDSPVEDPAFIEGLRTLKSHVKYYQAVELLEHDELDYHFKSDYSNDPYLLTIIEAYETKIIPVKDETYQRAMSILTGKAYLRTYRPKHVIPGYAYLMADSTGLYKIGHSKDPSSRVKSVTSRANPVTLICQIASDNAVYLEYELHERFHDERVSGEWFALTPDCVDYIKSLSGVLA
jgi:hypothetical protein